jgi:TolA-binding protein
MPRAHCFSFRSLPSCSILAVILAVLVLSPLEAQVEQAPAPRPLAGDADYERGLQAMTDHLPEVAASCFGKALAAGPLSAEDKATVEAKFLEALVRSGQNDKALALTEPFFASPAGTNEPPPGNLPASMVFWRSLALAGSGRLGEADGLLTRVTSNPGAAPEFYQEAVFTRSSILRALGSPSEGEAIKVLEEFVHRENDPAPTVETRNEALLRIAELNASLNRFREASDALAQLASLSPLQRSETAFLRARVALGEKRWEDAIADFSLLSNKTVDPTVVPDRMRELAVVGLADALGGAGRRPEAVALVTDFITSNPESTLLFPLFERLEAMEFFATPAIGETLVTWQHSDKPALAAFGSYYLGIAVKSAVSPEAAVAAFSNFVETFPDHFLVDRALLWLSQLHATVGDKEGALSTLKLLKDRTRDPAVLARIEFLEARAEFAAEDFKDAAEKFAALGENPENESATVATFNAALAALKSGNSRLFDGSLEHLGAFNRPNLRGELLLERGLYIAGSDPVESKILFDTFLHDYPGHSRAAEAYLALASLYLVEFPPKIKSARAQLTELGALKLAPAQAEAADYIAVWIEVSGENPEGVIKLGQIFIEKWPQSHHAPEILMKIAEVYLQRQDFANAQARFEALAEAYPTAPQAEPALFFAGKAAMRINTEPSREKALDIWQRVVKMKGELALAARMQQAMVKRVQKKDSEAIAIIDKILESNPEGDVLFEALFEKGQVLFIAGEATADGMKPAIDTFRSALAHPTISRKWRYEADYRLGRCLERAGDTDAALATYYEAIHRPTGEDPSMAPAEYEWYFRCGESAQRLLEARDNWQAAIAIYRQLGAIPGPRAQYALDRARTLELKHFVWPEDQPSDL